MRLDTRFFAYVTKALEELTYLSLRIATVLHSTNDRSMETCVVMNTITFECDNPSVWNE